MAPSSIIRLIFQPLKQHGIESCGANDLPDWKAGETLVHVPELCVPALPLQKFRVVLEPRDEIVDVIRQSGIAAVNVRQVRIGFARLLRSGRPHLVRIDVDPFDFYF